MTRRSGPRSTPRSRSSSAPWPSSWKRSRVGAADPEQPAGADVPSVLIWAGLQVQAGLMPWPTAEALTATHPSLVQATDEELERQLARARAWWLAHAPTPQARWCYATLCALAARHRRDQVSASPGPVDPDQA